MQLLDFLPLALLPLYTGLFVFIIHRSRFFESTGLSRTQISLAFLLKVVAGISLTLIYTYYYTDRLKQDIYRYFDDSVIISNVLFTDPLAWLRIMTGWDIYEPGTFQYLIHTEHFTHPSHDIITSNFLIIRVISVLNFFSFNNIYVDTLLFCIISFTGLMLLLKTFQPFFSGQIKWLGAALFLIPSIVFWSSGLLKETLLLFAIPAYIYSIMRWNRERSSSLLFIAGFSLLIVVLTKVHVAALLLWCSLLLPIQVFQTRSKFEDQRRLILFLLTGALAFLFFGSNIITMMMNKRNEFVSLAIAEHAGSALSLQLSGTGLMDLLRVIPSALVDSMIRPFVWEGSLLQKLFACETLALAGVVLFRLRHFHFPSGDKLWLAIFCLVFALLNYLVIGITAPILGAIVHYRIIAMLFFALGILLFTDKSLSPFEKANGS